MKPKVLVITSRQTVYFPMLFAVYTCIRFVVFSAPAESTSYELIYTHSFSSSSNRSFKSCFTVPCIRRHFRTVTFVSPRVS